MVSQTTEQLEAEVSDLCLSVCAEEAKIKALGRVVPAQPSIAGFESNNLYSIAATTSEQYGNAIPVLKAHLESLRAIRNGDSPWPKASASSPSTPKVINPLVAAAQATRPEKLNCDFSPSSLRIWGDTLPDEATLRGRLEQLKAYCTRCQKEVKETYFSCSPMPSLEGKDLFEQMNALETHADYLEAKAPWLKTAKATPAPAATTPAAQPAMTSQQFVAQGHKVVMQMLKAGKVTVAQINLHHEIARFENLAANAKGQARTIYDGKIAALRGKLTAKR